MTDALATISLVVTGSRDPDATVHARHWVIPCAMAEEFAQGMTGRFGQPIESVGTNAQMTAEYEHAASSGVVFTDPEGNADAGP